MANKGSSCWATAEAVVLQGFVKTDDMTSSFIEAVQANAAGVWVGLCVTALFLAFFLCFGNLRRQILILVVVAMWSATLPFYKQFYNMPIAQFAWFPFWVLMESVLLFIICFIEPITNFVARLLNIENTTIAVRSERVQEFFVIFSCVACVFINIVQLGSALLGYGRETAGYYDFFNRLFLSMAVLALITPAKKGFGRLRDFVNG